MEDKEIYKMKDALPTIQGGIGERHKFTRVHLKELQTPKNGYICYVDRYWLVDGDYALFYEGKYPQCNVDRAIIERGPNNGAQYSVIFVPVSYVRNPHQY